jgi:hypothetical protein
MLFNCSLDGVKKVRAEKVRSPVRQHVNSGQMHQLFIGGD